jgi:hypothetical protein
MNISKLRNDYTEHNFKYLNAPRNPSEVTEHTVANPHSKQPILNTSDMKDIKIFTKRGTYF